MSSGKGSQSQQVTNRVDIPSFLQPFMQQSAQTGQQALGGLQRSLSGDLVAGFNPTQQAAHGMGIDRATGGGGFFPTAQQQFLQTAQGMPLSSFIPQQALQALMSGAGGMSALGGPGMSALGGIAGGNFNIPGMGMLGNFAGQSGLPGQAMSTLGNLAGGQSPSMDALSQTARGDFLSGGPGFQDRFNAAMRQAQPHINSQFGAGGAGAATGGLAQAAMSRAAADSFSHLFGQERDRQLGASGQLSNLQTQAAQAMGGLGLSDRGQRIGAAGAMGGLGLGGLGQQLSGLGLMGNLGLGGNQQQLQSAGMLANLGQNERMNQLMAAGQLPGMASADLNLLSQIGGQQQGQAQREMSAPMAAQMQMLQAALGVPGGFSPLFGGTQTQPMQSNMFGNALGGAATGFEMFGPWGALGGGLLGGLLG